jgi:hypothetical protein
LAFIVCFVPATSTRAAGPAKPPRHVEATALSANDLNLRILALRAIHELDLNAEQISFLRLVATHTAGTPATHPGGQAGEKLRAAMIELHDALASADENRVAEAKSAVEDARDEDDDATFDETIVLTPNAAPHVDEVMKLLRSSQIAAYIGEHADEIGDPVELLVDGLDKARMDGDDDWEADRDDIIRDVATLAVGFRDDKGAKKLKDRVRDYLQKARKMPAAEFDAKRDELEKEAQKVVGTNHPLDCIKHWMETELAELLSNPQLPEALIERGKAAAEKAKADK